MELRENVFLICDGYSVMSFLAVQAFSLFPSAVGLVSVMSGKKKKMTGNIPGWVPELMENTNEMKSGNQIFCFGWRETICFGGLR